MKKNVKLLVLGAVVLLIIFVFYEKSREPQEINPKNPNSSPTSTSPELSITPIITATPILVEIATEKGIQEIVERVYKVNPLCRLDLLKLENESYSPQDFTLEKIAISLELGKFDKWEIAENPSKTFSAFIACEKQSCQPRLFIGNNKNSIIQEFNWTGKMPYRPIARIIWIGDEILSFTQLANPDKLVIVTLDVKNEKILFYWLVNYSCDK